tara:strand:- start:136 stop:594 length:459 start_codon:yes stop_codon:yes gene_type:complete
MIKRITNPEEFKQVIGDMNDLFDLENSEEGHVLDLKHNKETIINSFGSSQLLAWDVFVWGNKDEGKFNAMCIFLNDKSVKFGKNLFVEFLWLSKNPRVGFKVFKEAIKFAREKKFEYVVVSTAAMNPSEPKLKKLYRKLGFVKDSTTFIARL